MSKNVNRVWRLETRPEGTADENNLKLTRLIDGKAIETYPPVHRSMAGVYVQAIVQGFRPPRELMPLDPPMVDDDDQD